MKIQITDDAGQVYAEREMPQLDQPLLPDEYLETIERNVKLVQGNTKMMMGLLGCLQDAGIINPEGINADVIEVKTGVATMIDLFEKHSDHKKMGMAAKTAIGIGKSVAGKAKPLPLDVEEIGRLLHQFGQDNSVLLPGIGEYIQTIIEQLKAKFHEK